MAIDLETLATDLRDMTSQDWEAMREIWSTEHARRNELAALPGQVAHIADRLRETERHQPGAAFLTPASPIDAYMAGETITHNGQVYTCTVDWTCWDPTVLPDAWQTTIEGEES